MTIKELATVSEDSYRHGSASSIMVIWKCSKCFDDSVYVYQMLLHAPNVAILVCLACRLRSVPNKAKHICIKSKTYLHECGYILNLRGDEFLVYKFEVLFYKIRDLYVKASIIWSG